MNSLVGSVLPMGGGLEVANVWVREEMSKSVDEWGVSYVS